ncbi:hypothetical protein H9P43_007143 [Blastocladiella emersonii ATCC 22665]|nr:hypothetical protein H9P43_007143 [Blastocladiella emersonii ATCC 22665]
MSSASSSMPSLTSALDVSGNGLPVGAVDARLAALSLNSSGRSTPSKTAAAAQAQGPPPPIAIPGRGLPAGVLERRRSSSAGSPRPPTPTNKLAETAIGVREVARNIGRARVRVDTPKTVMIVNKLHDADLVRLTQEMTVWLIDQVRAADGDDVTVYVDAAIRDHPLFNFPVLAAQSPRYARQIHFWTPEFCAASPDAIDFVITLGGDGTVLYTSWLFQNIVPPVIPFHLGSLGFLTVFDFANYKVLLRQVFERGARVNLRMRFTCTVFQARDRDGKIIAKSLSRRRCASIKNLIDERQHQAAAAAAAASSSSGHAPLHSSLLANGTAAAGAAPAASPEPLSPLSAAFEPLVQQTRRTSMSLGAGAGGSPQQSTLANPCVAATGTASSSMTSFEHNGVNITTETFQVLNELVVDRGPSAYMSQLELFGDERHLTTVQADGLVVSTPTGSTAYSLSAGGSIVHPEVSATLVTPICPHTLSFRPMLLPDSMELKVCVPPTSRNTAWASFDGRHRIELKQGDFVSITASKFPFPTICHHDQSSDWFHSLARCLHWNERQRQKSFTGENAFTNRRGSVTDDDGGDEEDAGCISDDETGLGDDDEEQVGAASPYPTSRGGCYKAPEPPRPRRTSDAAAASSSSARPAAATTRLTGGASTNGDGVEVADEVGNTVARPWDVRDMVGHKL